MILIFRKNCNSFNNKFSQTYKSLIYALPLLPPHRRFLPLLRPSPPTTAQTRPRSSTMAMELFRPDLARP